MLLHLMMVDVITEEAAATWWMRRYTGGDSWIVRNGRIRMAGTPLYDTNWMPAAALIAVMYREMGKSVNAIAKTINKSHHAVTDLFARVDRFEVVNG